MDFDPYETWLGIPADQRPPSYYDLLGVAPDESEPAAIDRAALRRMAKVRLHQIGPHSDQSQEVLAELARARLILMDSDRRADYDATLRARGESRTGRPIPPEKVENRDTQRRRPRAQNGAPDVLDSLVITEHEGEGQLTLRPSTKRASASWKKRLIIGTPLSISAVLVGALLFLAAGRLSLQQKAADAVRIDQAPVTATHKTKPTDRPSMYSGKTKPEAPPPRLAKKPVDPPGEGSVPSTSSGSSNHGNNEDVDGSTASGRSEPQGSQADPGGGIAPSDGKAVVGQNIPGQEDQQRVVTEGDSTDEVLKEHHLKREGSLYVLESEADVKNKTSEIQRLSAELTLAQMQQQAAVSTEQRQQTIYNLDDEIARCRADIRSANREMEQIPRFFRWGAFINNFEAERHATLLAFRNETEAYLDQAVPFLNRLRNRPFDAQAKQRADASVRDKQESYDQARDDLRKLVDETKQKYKELDKNEEIKRALDALGKKTKAKVKLGPSREFEATVKLLDNPRRRKRGVGKRDIPLSK